MKRTEQTVYYCDMCGAPVIAAGRIGKQAEYLMTSNLPIEAIDMRALRDSGMCMEVPDSTFAFNEINTFEIPYIDLSTELTNNGNTVECIKQTKSLTKHICKKCADEIGEKYLELIRASYEWGEDVGLI